MKAELKKITPTGIKVFVIENDNGMRAELLSYGAIISKLFVKDRNGNLVDVVAGYENEDDYAGDICYFGALIGRVCNRTAGAKFSLDGVTYELAKNNGNNHLHGGAEGFNKKEYSAEIVGPASIKFSRISPNKEEGYPGTMTVAVTYTLTNDNALEIAYEATSDKRTPCALTNHSYFNLNGSDGSTILDHELFVDADRFTDLHAGTAAPQVHALAGAQRPRRAQKRQSKNQLSHAAIVAENARGDNAGRGAERGKDKR